MTKQTVVVLGTGGTISGRAAQAGDNVGYRAGEVAVADLVAGIPLPPGVHVESEQVAQIDSKDMGPTVWRPLLARLSHHLARPEVCGVVVTHGTDTLEETAYLLQCVLNPAKPVVLACAMRPATALVPDGPQNLADALVVAAEKDARGVVAVCAGRIHGALDVQKVHPYRVDAFSSGDAGAVGTVEEGRCTRWRPWPDTSESHDVRWLPDLLARSEWPRVEWVTSHADNDGGWLRMWLASTPDHAEPGNWRLDGVVVAGTGNGTLHVDLLACLQQAQARGVRVWRTTRCVDGRVLPGGEGSIPCVALPPAKARLALMLDLL